MDYDLAINIRRPPSDVFAFLADVQDHAVHPGSPVSAMEKMPPGPTREGTRWREVIRLAPGIRMTVRSEATMVVPPWRLSERFEAPGMYGELTYLLQPIPEGTRLRQQESVHPNGVMRVVASLMDRMLRRRLAARLEDIRHTLEITDRGSR